MALSRLITAASAAMAMVGMITNVAKAELRVIEPTLGSTVVAER